MRYLKLYERFIRENTETATQTETPGPAPEIPSTGGKQRFGIETSFESTELYKFVVKKLEEPEFQSLVAGHLLNIEDGIEGAVKEGFNFSLLFTLIKEMNLNQANVFANEIQKEIDVKKLHENLKNLNDFNDDNIKDTVKEILGNEEKMKSLAQEALKYAGILMAMGAAVKVFYLVGEEAFKAANRGGFTSVAGGVILILLYLAYKNLIKNAGKKS